LKPSVIEVLPSLEQLFWLDIGVGVDSQPQFQTDLMDRIHSQFPFKPIPDVMRIDAGGDQRVTTAALNCPEFPLKGWLFVGVRVG